MAIPEENKENDCNKQLLVRGKVPVEVFVNQKLTTKDIHDTLWRCRDFELSHLWQRSVFLSAFLVLCFTGYGMLIFNMASGSDNLFKLNLMALAVGVVAALFSVMWIMMGKASKAWYEKYEHGISAFEKNTKYADGDVTKIGGFAVEEIENYELLSLNNCLFSTQGGAYSPSKINIGIGQFSLALWIVVILFHTLYHYKLICTWSWTLKSWFWPWPLIIGGGVALVIFFYLFRSSSLSSLNKNKKTNEKGV